MPPHKHRHRKNLKYWLKKLSGTLPKLDLPLDYTRAGKVSFEGGSIFFKFNRDLTQQLIKIANDNNATIFMVLITSYKMLLSKITNQTDIIIGITGSQRVNAELKDTVGMFGSLLTLRNKIESQNSFIELLSMVKKDLLESFENQDYPFESYLKKIDDKRETTRNPVFDTLFNFLNYNSANNRGNNIKSGVTFESIGFKNKSSKFDIFLMACYIDNEIHFEITYRKELFKEETIKKIVNDYININQQISNNPRIIHKDIELAKSPLNLFS